MEDTTQRDREYQKLVATFTELKDVLESVGEANWIKGVKHIIAILHDTTGDQIDNLNSAKRAFVNMNRGAGSFADYYITSGKTDWRPSDRNADLERLVDQLWKLLDLKST